MKKFYGLLVILNTVVVLNCFADQITIENKTPDSIYVALYYVSQLGTKKITRTTNPILLLPHAQVGLERPSFKVGYDRELVFATQEQELKNKFSELEFNQLHKQNIGFFKGTKFFLTIDRGHYFIYSSLYEPIQTVKQLTIQEVMKVLARYGVKNSHEQESAVIRPSTALSLEEKNYLITRDSIIKKEAEQLVGRTISTNALPRIAVCLSGGGFRAMLGSIGFLSGLQQEHMLDLVSYISALSGSAWAVVPWIMTGLSLSEMNILLQKATRGDFYKLSYQDYQDIQLAILTKWINKTTDDDCRSVGRIGCPCSIAKYH